MINKGDAHKLLAAEIAGMSPEEIRERFTWEQVQAPKAWLPNQHDDELLGFYAGQTKRIGTYGEYTAVLVFVPGQSFLRMVTGTRIVQLVDASMLELGQPVRIVWRGYTKISGDRKMKNFDLFMGVEESNAAP